MVLTSIRNLNLPYDEERYINELCHKLQSLVGDNLVGVYLLGSASQSCYVKGESDLDIQMVVAQELTEQNKIDVSQVLRHDNFPCPATKLEFVTYTKYGLSSPELLQYSINLNTGKTIADYVSFDYTSDPRHWFVLDIAMAEKYGINLVGQPFSAVFPNIDQNLLLDVMQECLNWFVSYFPGEACYHCACRILYYLEKGELVSKRDALDYIKSSEKLIAIEQQQLVDWVLVRLKTYVR